MIIYWVIVEVNFKEPMINEGTNESEAVGFFQTIGCTEDSESLMKESIYSYLKESEWFEAHGAEVEFDISIIEEKDVETEILNDEEINSYILSSPFSKGIWYKSGKAFFHDETNNDEMHLVEIAPKNVH